jgi:hypothetical protein
VNYWISDVAGITKIRVNLRVSRDLQPFHDLPVSQVLFDYLVDILPVNIAVPDRLRVHDHHRSFRTTIQAARGVNPDPTLAGQPQRLAALLGIVAESRCAESLATLTAVFTKIGTEKDMMSVIRHLADIPSRML